MPSYYADLFAAVREAVVAVWPETAASGVYQGVEIGQIPFERKAEDDELPFAIVDFDLVESGEWGIQNAVDDGLVTIYRVASRDDDLDSLVEELEALRTRLYSVALAEGQVRDYPSLSFGAGLPLNQFFLVTQRPFWAGAVRARVIVGEVP